MNYTPDTSLCRLIILQLARSASPQGETGRRGGGERRRWRRQRGWRTLQSDLSGRTQCNPAPLTDTALSICPSIWMRASHDSTPAHRLTLSPSAHIHTVTSSSYLPFACFLYPPPPTASIFLPALSPTHTLPPSQSIPAPMLSVLTSCFNGRCGACL